MKTLAEKIEVMQAALRGEPIEYRYNENDDWRTAHESSIDTIFNWGVYDYRVAVTKDSFDWAHVSEDMKWFARDSNQRVFFYEVEPKEGEVHWRVREGNSFNAKLLSSLKIGTCDWRDSLQERPK